MLYDFRFKTAVEYLDEMVRLLDDDSHDIGEYEELADEYLLFDEVSGSA